MTTKNLSEETEQKIVKPNPIEVITFLSPSFSNPFQNVFVRDHSHT